MASVTHLRSFHLVATAGGYSQAAREMAVSQSTLSGQVRQLEAASGMALFERGPRGVTLTEEGRALFEVTSRLFVALGEAADLLGSRKADGGRLRVASDGMVHALPVLRELRLRRPQLVFSILLHNSDSVLDQIVQYRADVGVTALRPTDDRFHVRPLTRMEIGVFFPTDHPWTGRGSIRPVDLAGVPFVLRERGSQTRELFEKHLAAAGVAPGPIVEVSSRDGVRDAVAGGFGMGVTADLEFGFDSRLHFLPLRDPVLTIDEYVVCLAERRRVPMIDSFFRCAAETFAPLRPAAAAA